MESDSKSDNIILGPWNGSGKKPPKKTLSKTDKIQLDMLHIDELSESVMIQMIHTFAEKGVDIAETHLGNDHGITITLRNSHIVSWKLHWCIYI